MISHLSHCIKWTGLVATLALALGGCVNMQSNVALYGQEQWSGVQAMQLSAEFAEMMKQAESDPNASVETEGLDNWLQQAQNASELAGVNVEFSEIAGADGSKTYVLQASGQGYQQMNQALFEGKANISVNEVNGQRQISIDYTFEDPTGENETPPAELTPAEQQMQQQMLTAFGLGFSFRISGGEIITSNATRVEGSTAVWENPTKIQVTLTEAAQFNPQTIAVADAPEGATFDVQALTSIMEQAVQDMQPTAPQSNTNPPSASRSTTAPASEAAPTTTSESDAASDSAPATAVQPAAPTQSDANLPASGGTLPQREALPPVVLAGIILIILGGAGVASLRRAT